MFGALSGFSGSLFLVARELHFHHGLNTGKYDKVTYGAFSDLVVDKQATEDFIQSMALLLIAEAFLYGLVSVVLPTEESWLLGFVACFGTILFVWVFGFATEIVDHHGGLMPIGSALKFFSNRDLSGFFLFFAALFWPYAFLILVPVLNPAPAAQIPYLVTIFGIPMVINVGFMFLFLGAGTIAFPEKDFLCTCNPGRPEIRPRKKPKW